MHEHINGFLVSHGSSTVPQEYVAQINEMGGKLENAFGIDVDQLVDVAKCGINKINVDTDIRLACTRNILKLFLDHPELQSSPAIGDIFARMRSNPKNFDPRNYLQCMIDTVITGDIPNEDVGRIVACMKDGVMESVAPLLVQFGSYRKSHLIRPVTLEQMADKYKKEGI